MVERVFTSSDLRPREPMVACAVPVGTIPLGIGMAKRRPLGNYELLTGPEDALDVRRVACSCTAGFAAVATGSTHLITAIEFSLHLRAVRSTTDCHVISETRPDDGASLLAFPHLVAVRTPQRDMVTWQDVGEPAAVGRGLTVQRAVNDVVLWELMPVDRLRALSIDAATVQRWRERLEDLIRHRCQLRCGEADPRVVEALGKRYLSFRFVCDNDALFGELYAPGGKPGWNR